MSNLFWLIEAQMARLRPFFPESRGRPRVDDLRVFSGIVFINRLCLRRCNAPQECGLAKTPITVRSAGVITAPSPGSWWAWLSKAPIRGRS